MIFYGAFDSVFDLMTVASMLDILVAGINDPKYDSN